MKKFIKVCLFCCFTLTVYLGVLYFGQNDFLFYPDKQYRSPNDISLPTFSEVLLDTTDKVPVMMWYYAGEKKKPAILFLHGNAGQLSTFAPHLVPLAQAGYPILMLEYRGFGKTEGEISQSTIVQDATQAFDWLKNNGHSKIVVYGYSFGTAFASALTSVRDVDALILTAPFSSLEKLVSEKPLPLAKFVLKDKYHSVEHLKNYQNPLLIIHGKKDRLIPYHHSQILFDAAISNQKQLELLPDDTHPSIFFSRKNIPFILKFLQQF